MCEYVSVRVAAAILCLVVCCISSVFFFFSSAVFVYLFSFFSFSSLPPALLLMSPNYLIRIKLYSERQGNTATRQIASFGRGECTLNGTVFLPRQKKSSVQFSARKLPHTSLRLLLLLSCGNLAVCLIVSIKIGCPSSVSASTVSFSSIARQRENE